MLKEKFTKVKQKTGEVIKKACKYAYDNRGTIGYIVGAIATSAIYEHCINPERDRNCIKAGLVEGYKGGYIKGRHVGRAEVLDKLTDTAEELESSNEDNKN